MNDLLENVHALGLVVQALGAALIALLCLMLNRVVHRPALSAWVRGWLSLAGALIALLIEQAVPSTAALTLPLYLFGEYLFGYWIIEGCAHFGGRRWPVKRLAPLIAGLAIFSLAVPQVIGYDFARIFILQSLVLAAMFGAALYALASVATGDTLKPGLLAMRIALSLLAVIFLAYIPIFAAHVFLSTPLPMTLLKLSSAVHLAFEFLLGFGGAVLVLGQSHHGLAARNDALFADYEKFRVQAERDALTNTFNRHAFFQMLDSFRATGTAVRGCAAMIDVDGLKQINDTFGHVLGDTAIVRVARAIAQVAGEGDRLFRWGGDEFLLVSLDQNAAAVLKRLDLLNPALVIPESIAVQVSYGVVEFNAADELFDAVKRADSFMYARKRERATLKRHQLELFDASNAAALKVGSEPAA